MKEKTLAARPGMPMLVLFILLYLAMIALIVLGGNLLSSDRNIGALPLVFGIIGVFVGIIPFFGFRIIKPQEALVLTLFGNYTGTLREPGFFFVHPFSSAVNPAAKTRLGQSSDVDQSAASKVIVTAQGGGQVSIPSKKISLKIMTLNNAKQKVNDALGNPVEIGIAVMWRVVATAQAVFNVDNYKEYLSLQCDSALRDIVRIYPYDVAPGIDTTGDGLPDEGSLRGSSALVAELIRQEIQ